MGKYSTRPMNKVLTPSSLDYWLRYGLIIYILSYTHRWEGEMGSSQHKSPHQIRAFSRGLYVVTSAEIIPSRLSNAYCSLEMYLFWNYTCQCQDVLTMQYVFSRTNIYPKRQNRTEQWIICRYVRECEMGWSHHTSISESKEVETSLVKANSMSARSR